MRFSGFDDEWQSCRFDELFDFQVAGDMKKELFNEEFIDEYKYPLYANALENEGLLGYYKEYKYNPNSITVTARGNIGHATARKNKFNAVGRLIILTPKEDLNIEFFTEYINNNVKIYIESTGVPQLTAPSLKINKLHYPTLNEQNKISNLLIMLNNKIELLGQKHQLYQYFKKYLMQQIFTQKLRFKNDKQWNVYLLRNFINEYNERMGNKSNLPILSSTLNGIFLQNEYFNKSVSSKDVKNYKIVPNGYFTYRSMSDTGKFRFNIQSIVEVGIISPAYPVFSTQNIDDYFLYYYLNNSNFIKKQILSLKEGGTRYALSFSKFKKLKISLPSLEEQKKIANFLSAVDKKIDLIQTQIQKMEEFKKGLLQQMFVVQLILSLLQNKKHI